MTMLILLQIGMTARQFGVIQLLIYKDALTVMEMACLMLMTNGQTTLQSLMIPMVTALQILKMIVQTLQVTLHGF